MNFNCYYICEKFNIKLIIIFHALNLNCKMLFNYSTYTVHILNFNVHPTLARPLFKYNLPLMLRLLNIEFHSIP